MAMPSPSAVTPAGSASRGRAVIPTAIGPGARRSRIHVVLGVRLAAPQEVDRQRQDERQAAQRADLDGEAGVLGAARRPPSASAMSTSTRRRPRFKAPMTIDA